MSALHVQGAQNGFVSIVRMSWTAETSPFGPEGGGTSRPVSGGRGLQGGAMMWFWSFGATFLESTWAWPLSGENVGWSRQGLAYAQGWQRGGCCNPKQAHGVGLKLCTLKPNKVMIVATC